MIDLKIKIKNVQELRDQLQLTYEKGVSYSQKSIIHLDTIFEYGFEEIFKSFRKKFFWSFCSRRIKNKAFHRIWDTLKELQYNEDKIYGHLDRFDDGFDERILKYNAALDNLIAFRTQRMNDMAKEQQSDLAEYYRQEKEIMFAWQSTDYNKSHYYHSYRLLIKPLLAINPVYYDSKAGLEFHSYLYDCHQAYLEIENAVETYNHVFSIYLQFYRNKNRLLRKCLGVMKA